MQEQIDACTTCTEAKMVINGVSTLTQNMKGFYGPDDFITNTTHQNPMKIVSIGKAGPFYLDDGHGGHNKKYILICMELLTYKRHLVPLPRLDTLHFVRALEMLQAICGQMTTIVLDDASFHNPLSQTEDVSQDTFRKSTLQGLLDRGHTATLHKSGIDIVIASSKRHE